MIEYVYIAAIVSGAAVAIVGIWAASHVKTTGINAVTERLWITKDNELEMKKLETGHNDDGKHKNK